MLCTATIVGQTAADLRHPPLAPPDRVCLFCATPLWLRAADRDAAYLEPKRPVLCAACARGAATEIQK